MEKKSTKIAYFVALGVFIVLLVVLGISYKGTLPILIEGAHHRSQVPSAFLLPSSWPSFWL